MTSVEEVSLAQHPPWRIQQLSIATRYCMGPGGQIL